MSLRLRVARERFGGFALSRSGRVKSTARPTGARRVAHGQTCEVGRLVAKNTSRLRSATDDVETERQQGLTRPAARRLRELRKCRIAGALEQYSLRLTDDEFGLADRAIFAVSVRRSWEALARTRVHERQSVMNVLPREGSHTGVHTLFRGNQIIGAGYGSVRNG